jgi:SNF2 family DNA or RNA helicase
MILALKQICNHPATFLKGAKAAQQNAEESTPAGDAQAETAQESSAPAGENGAASTSQAEKAPELSSGKLQMLLDLLTSIQEQGEKTLIFTQFAEMGELLKSTIEKELNLKVHFYHGGCSQTQREAMVRDLQENPDCKVLILSLKAGGTGLNLTAASQVIHYDLWWNPAIEAQATDRAFRIGQTRNVQVHRFITKGTFEEKINALLETKKSIANMTVSAGETWLADMDDKQLGEVFGLDNTLV